MNVQMLEKFLLEKIEENQKITTKPGLGVFLIGRATGQKLLAEEILSFIKSVDTDVKS